jgi:hypothetical protein
MITTRNAIIASAFPCDDDVERKVDNIFKRKHPVLEQNSYLLTDDIKIRLDWKCLPTREPFSKRKVGCKIFWWRQQECKTGTRGAEGSAKFWLW